NSPEPRTGTRRVNREPKDGYNDTKRKAAPAFYGSALASLVYQRIGSRFWVLGSLSGPAALPLPAAQAAAGDRRPAGRGSGATLRPGAGPAHPGAAGWAGHWGDRGLDGRGADRGAAPRDAFGARRGEGLSRFRDPLGASLRYVRGAVERDGRRHS